MASGVEKTFHQGQIICKERDPGNQLFILKSGTIGIYKDDNLVSLVDAPGTVLGEMSIILAQHRTATLKAESETTVNEIKVTLEELVGRFPSFAVKLLQTLALRVKETTEHLSETMVRLDEEEQIIDELERQSDEFPDSE